MSKVERCWFYHSNEVRMQKCTLPCAYRKEEELTQQTPTVARFCTTKTARLFIKDRIDTGSGLCV
jgi:hypothetical protein